MPSSIDVCPLHLLTSKTPSNDLGERGLQIIDIGNTLANTVIGIATRVKGAVTTLLEIVGEQ